MGVHKGERDHSGGHVSYVFTSHPALLQPSPAITAATSFLSREGLPQYLNRAFSAPKI